MKKIWCLSVLLIVCGASFCVWASNNGVAHSPSTKKGVSKKQKDGRWIEGDLAKGLRRAQGKRPVLVEVYASWCTPCNQLNNEVLHAEAGERLLKQAVGVRVDFETAAGRDVTARFGILGLPTTLVLSAKGKELGRVEGYPGRKEFLQGIKEALAGRFGLEVLKARAKARPKDADAQISYAQALMVRGKVGVAAAILRGFMIKKDRASARAHRLWGRWLLRVKRDGARATRHFLAARAHFKGTRQEWGFLYWAAKAHQHQGHKDKAIELFDAWIRSQPGRVTPLEYKADFMVHYKYPAQQTELIVRKALKLAPRMSWLHYLLAQLRLRQRDVAGARRAIQTAISMKPKLAIYQNFARRLSSPPARR